MFDNSFRKKIIKKLQKKKSDRPSFTKFLDLVLFFNKTIQKKKKNTRKHKRKKKKEKPSSLLLLFIIVYVHSSSLFIERKKKKKKIQIEIVDVLSPVNVVGEDLPLL